MCNSLNSKVVFFTFCSNNYKPTGKRIRKEAIKFGVFNKILIFHENDMDKSYRNKYRLRFRDRGMGFWMWKSYFAKKVFDELDTDDILVYCDAGCTINKEGINRFVDYIDMVKKGSGILAFDQNFLERQYTKRDLLHFVFPNESAYYDNTQYFAGVWMLRKNDVTTRLIREWYEICHNSYDLISDSPSKQSNYPGFVRNSADQSALSLLMHKYKASVVPYYETYRDDKDWSKMVKYPFVASRLKKKILILRIKNLINRNIADILRLIGIYNS